MNRGRTWDEYSLVISISIGVTITSSSRLSETGTSCKWLNTCSSRGARVITAVV